MMLIYRLVLRSALALYDIGFRAAVIAGFMELLRKSTVSQSPLHKPFFAR